MYGLYGGRSSVRCPLSVNLIHCKLKPLKYEILNALYRLVKKTQTYMTKGHNTTKLRNLCD